MTNEGLPGGHILAWERDHRPPGQHQDTCDGSREPWDKGHQAGAVVREGFLEDGVVRAETFRLSGSEPTLEAEEALLAKGTACAKATR